MNTKYNFQILHRVKHKDNLNTIQVEINFVSIITTIVSESELIMIISETSGDWINSIDILFVLNSFNIYDDVINNVPIPTISHII